MTAAQRLWFRTLVVPGLAYAAAGGLSVALVLVQINRRVRVSEDYEQVAEQVRAWLPNLNAGSRRLLIATLVDATPGERARIIRRLSS